MSMSGTPKNPREIAEQILWFRRDLDTTTMHILKLVYLCHGWMLGHAGEKLITEPVEAWRYGPVIPSLYDTYKSFRNEPIDTVPKDLTDQFSEYQNLLINNVLEAYKGYSALNLSSITHQPGTPWDLVYNKSGRWKAIIPDRIIKRHYEKRIKAAAQNGTK